VVNPIGVNLTLVVDRPGTYMASQEQLAKNVRL